MPTPSEAELQAQIGYAVKLLNETLKYGSANTPNVVGMVDTLVQAMETDYSSEVSAGVQALRSSIAAAASPGTARRILDPYLRDYARLRDFPDTDPFAILDRLYDDFIARSKTVQKRAFTFGSVSAGGGNVGTGTVLRMTKDRNALDIENASPDVWTALCVADEFSGGRKHEEVFEVRGGDASRDRLEQLGTGTLLRVPGISGRDSQQLVRNPSFDQLDGSLITAPDSIPGWTVAGAVGNLELWESNYYRGFEGDGGTQRSLLFETNESISQALSVRRAQFDPRRPYVCQIAYNREVGSGDGTLTLTLGAVSKAVVLAAQTGWNILKIDLDDDGWYDKFGETALDLTIALASRTTGTLLVDDLILAPMANVGGTFAAIVGGATPFLRDDTFTWTDTVTEAILQRWFVRAYSKYLPHATSSPTWAEP